MLLVSTAQGAAGRDVAALIGSSILNLVDAVIREQGELPPEQRRGALVVVDEMQSMPGVDYESMLSELGKFGASLVLATQSLDKLDELSPTMRTTVLANIGCLAVFQVAGSGRPAARLGAGPRARPPRRTSSPCPCTTPTCAPRSGRSARPAFSMEVLKPGDGSAETAARIRDEAAAYLLTEEEVAAQQEEGRRRVEEFRKALEAERNKHEQGKGDASSGAPRGKPPRSKRVQQPRGPAGDGA